MKEDIKKISVYLPEKDHEALKIIYAKTGKRVSTIVNLAIKNYLNNTQKENLENK